MLLKKVKANWVFVNRVDENGFYRVSFTLDDEQRAKLDKVLDACLQEKGKSKEGAGWYGPSRPDPKTGEMSYTAKRKREFTNKKGDLVTFKLKVYDARAKEMEVAPSVANGAILNIAVSPYYSTFKNKYGVSLNLDSVQLLKYEEYGDENPFEDESDEFAVDIKEDEVKENTQTDYFN